MTGKEKIDFCCSFTLFSTQSSIYIIVAPVIPNPSLTFFYYKLQSWTKVLTQLSKANAFYRRPSVTSKSIFFVDSQPPSPHFQCCSMLRGHFNLVTTLKRGERVEMSKLDIKNSLVERNGSFLESVSTTFVYDCLNYILHILKLSQYHHCSVYSEIFSIIV